MHPVSRLLVRITRAASLSTAAWSPLRVLRVVLCAQVPLLLACRFFDAALVGHLEDRDVEDILHLTQPHTSRRMVQELVAASCGQARRLRYADFGPLSVPFYPGLARPAGLGGAADAGGSGAVAVDGALVDVRGLQARVEGLRGELAAEQARVAACVRDTRGE